MFRQKDKKTKRQNRIKAKRYKGKKRVEYCDVRAVLHSCDVFDIIYYICNDNFTILHQQTITWIDICLLFDIIYLCDNFAVLAVLLHR